MMWEIMIPLMKPTIALAVVLATVNGAQDLRFPVVRDGRRTSQPDLSPAKNRHDFPFSAEKHRKTRAFCKALPPDCHNLIQSQSGEIICLVGIE